MPDPLTRRRRLPPLLDAVRLRLAGPDAPLLLALLGILTGLAAGLLIITFRQLIELLQAGFLPAGAVEDYEALGAWARLLLPVLGGLLIGLVFQWLARGQTVVGVVHVMERLAYHQGHLGLRALLLQFFGAVTAIASGHSVGREGPSVHLGAAAGSLLGQRLALPNNALRTLAACGVAAAIGASFNTPLAGVVFAMEVVMLEYTLASFLPLVLAAVTATALTVAVYGPSPAFAASDLALASLHELPWVVLLGIACGAAAAALIWAIRRLAGLGTRLPFWLRTTLAGLVVGLCALPFPQVMSIGYDTVDAALLGQLGIALLIGITLAKGIATASAVALGVPAGVIGPTLFLGATLGGALGLLAGLSGLGSVSPSGVYALLGMGALMGAALQAPLAALVAVLELTGNPNITLPAMLAIAAASLTSRAVFRQPSLFLALLRARGLDYDNDPVTQALRRIGVASAMERSFALSAPTLERVEAVELLAGQPRWLVVGDGEGGALLMPAVDLARALEEAPEAPTLELLSVPARRLQAVPVAFEASLQEALDALEQGQAEALTVERTVAPGLKRLQGVLTRADIEGAYRYPGRG
jgi:H+/Cl- antiporter ClcA